MQTALTFAPNLVAPLKPSKHVAAAPSFAPKITASHGSSSRGSPIKVATVSYDTTSVNYNSMIS